MAIDSALEDIHKGNTGNVPNNIKTHSNNYKYPHNYPKVWIKQQYLPDNVKEIAVTNDGIEKLNYTIFVVLPYPVLCHIFVPSNKNIILFTY